MPPSRYTPIQVVWLPEIGLKIHKSTVIRDTYTVTAMMVGQLSSLLTLYHTIGSVQGKNGEHNYQNSYNMRVIKNFC